MKVVKVSEVSGVVLDWLVAKCDISSCWILDLESFMPNHRLGRINYSTNWAQGGPIIDREKIGHCWCSDGYSQAHQFDAEDEFNSAFYQTGPTPLIAAMRCYVASKLGETVEVPDKLFKSIN